ncbi:MAG: hypothetical protein HYR96_07630 [Deltaproteobacteria bacterium]|nr:hypothetical protein [Deltaproteobacteria bacterium]
MAAREPNSLFSLRQCISKVFSRFSPKLHLTMSHERALLEWGQQHDHGPAIFPDLPEQNALFLLAQLPKDLREEIFLHNGTVRSQSEVLRILRATGVEPNRHFALKPLLWRMGNTAGSRKQFWAHIESEMDRMGLMNPYEFLDLKRDTQARIETAVITDKLFHSPELYQLKFEEGSAVTSDGSRLPIRGTTSRRTLVLAISPERILSSDHEGLTPDGYFLTNKVDQLRHEDGMVLIEVPRDSAGRYHTLSHIQVLSFYSSQYSTGEEWRTKSETERKQILAELERDPLAFAQSLYRNHYPGRNP